METALERRLSVELMHGATKPKIRKFTAGELITEQGEPGDELFLVLDGVVRVEVDGDRLAEYGPGSMHGETGLPGGGHPHLQRAGRYPVQVGHGARPASSTAAPSKS